MLPEFKKAKKCIAKSQEQFFEFSQKHHLGGLFGSISKRAMPEGNKLRQVYSKDLQRETEMTKIQTSFTFDVDEIKENAFTIYEQLFQNAKEFASQQMQMMIKNINEVTEMTGNVIKSKGEYSVEDFYRSIEMVEIEFDKDGKPVLPTIVSSPSFIDNMINTLKKHEHLPESKTRMDEIINLKRKQWYDRENNRKLVD
jgi:hypothetical protein